MLQNVWNFIKGLAVNDRETVQKADAALHSLWYFLPIAVLTALANMFSLELVVYTLFVALGVWICLRGSDLLPLIPLTVLCYLAPSRANNPGRETDSVFSLANGGVWLILLAVVIAAAVGWRMWKERERWRKQSFRLLPGMIGLAVSFALGGIFSPAVPKNTLPHLLFTLIQAACLILPYLVFSAGVDWKRVRRDWFGWFGLALGCLLIWELLWIFLTQKVITDGVIVRKEIYTGWGMYNNIGGLLMVMIPFPFYLGSRYNKDLAGLLGGTAFWMGVLMSSSRNAILLGSALYLFCVIRILYRKADRKKLGKAVLYMGIALVAAVVLFWKPLAQLFRVILNQGLDMSSRENIYLKGLQLFAQYPVFGVSFFSPEYQPWSWSSNDSFTAFFPGRWHNTYVQLLATGGLVCLLSYCWHRWQTVRLLLENKRRQEVFFITASLTAFLASSIFDCHFFNAGPVIYYSLALAFAERICKSQVPHRKKR